MLPDSFQGKTLELVIRAEAGTHNFKRNKYLWVPAFAGMTRRERWRIGADVGVSQNLSPKCKTPRRNRGV
jgi:hypothetical protein